MAVLVVGMGRKANILSISGGKDSTAMLLLAIERGTDFRCVFADTGHEHEQTYEYIVYLEKRLGIIIERVKADFTAKIEHKREFIKANWHRDLTSGRPGKWLWTGEGLPDGEQPPAPAVRDRPATDGKWVWQRELVAISDADAKAKVATALAVLQPTGNAFLDMCLWKGRFPSTKGRFCTDELKALPIFEQVFIPILRSGIGVRSWQGVRADESARRATYKVFEEMQHGIVAYRPILHWTAQDVFAIHRKHDVKPNPLYMQGMGRVGCMPCIMCRKSELAEIGRRFPDVLDRLRNWERLVSEAGKRGCATFFDVRPLAEDKYDVHYTTHGVDEAYKWSLTERGGRQFNLFLANEEIPACSSIYGLCEMPERESAVSA